MSIGWRRALTLGVAIALIHRVALMLWLVAAWTLFGNFLPDARPDFHATADAQLPTLTGAESVVLGVWRRWDAVHYLDLADNGYRTEQAGSTVFGALTPLAIRAAAALTGGSVDVGSILVQTIAFGVALALLIRLCAVIFDDAALGVTAAIATAILPLSFYYAAPMSESLYLALAIGAVLAAVERRWLIAALLGCLATLTRSQGAVLAIVIGLALIEAHGWRWTRPATWPRALARSFVPGLTLLLVPIGYAVFLIYRESIGLPSLGDTYAAYSWHFFVNPIEGVWINLRWIVQNPGAALASIDVWFMIGSIGLTVLTCLVPRHRRAPLIAFSVLHLAVYLSKINWVWGTTDQVLFSQSFARYSIVLFPLVILLADGARRLARPLQSAAVGLTLLALVIASALYTVALVGP